MKEGLLDKIYLLFFIQQICITAQLTVILGTLQCRIKWWHSLPTDVPLGHPKKKKELDEFVENVVLFLLPNHFSLKILTREHKFKEPIQL